MFPLDGMIWRRNPSCSLLFGLTCGVVALGTRRDGEGMGRTDRHSDVQGGVASDVFLLLLFPTVTLSLSLRSSAQCEDDDDGDGCFVMRFPPAGRERVYDAFLAANGDRGGMVPPPPRYRTL